MISDNRTERNKCRRNLGRWAAAICLVLAFSAVPAHADLIISLQPVTLNPAPGDSGDALEVVLHNTGSDVHIAGFNFDISTSDTDITFTDATFNTVLNPYIFAGNSLFGPDIVNPGFTPGQEISASDSVSNPGTFTTLTSSQDLSLGEVFYNVAQNAALGPANITFNQGNTTLSDENTNPVIITTSQDLTIDIETPEPSTIAMTLGAAALVAALVKRKRSA